MRAGTLVAVAGLFLGLTGAQALVNQSTTTHIDTPVVAACSVQVEGCEQPSLDESRQFFISHRVLSGGCAGSDLHVMRYRNEASPAKPHVAAWCS
jgi:hypothetical protein